MRADVRWTLAFLLVLAVGIVAFARHERAVGRLEAESARQDSIARAETKRADAWQRTALELSTAAAKLAEQVRRDSARVVQLLARAPRIDTLWRTDSAGSAVPFPVVAKTDYDVLGAACSRLAGDCSQALSAKDLALAARDSALAALRRRATADSLKALARVPRSGFWPGVATGAGACLLMGQLRR